MKHLVLISMLPIVLLTSWIKAILDVIMEGEIDVEDNPLLRWKDAWHAMVDGRDNS